MTIPNTPADKAGKVISKEFNVDENPKAKMQIVFKAPKDETLETKKIANEITNALNDIKKQDSSVETVASPFQLNNVDSDKKIGYAEVTYTVTPEKVTSSSIDKVLDRISKTNDKGIQTEVRGDNITFSESMNHFAEVAGIVVAFFILAVTFASFIAAGLPIITAVIGLGIGLLTILIGTNFIDIQSVSMSLAAMLGLAVGIDYSLFIITRFRQQLSKGSSVQEAVAIATGTAGSAVVFAGLTVIIGLLGLAVTKIPFLTMMGISAALSILTAVLVSIVVLPSILGMIGHKIVPAKKKVSNKEKRKENPVIFIATIIIIGMIGFALTKTSLFLEIGVSSSLNIILKGVFVAIIVLPVLFSLFRYTRSSFKKQSATKDKNKEIDNSNAWGRLVTKHPLIVSFVSIALLVIIALPFFHMNLGLPTEGTSKSTETTERRAYDLLTEGYGEGIHSSLVVVARASKLTDKTPDALNSITQDLQKLSDVKMVAPAIPGPSEKVYMINVVPNSGPDDIKTKKLVKLIRDKSSQTEKESGIELMVTGTTAMNIDISQKLNDALPIFASLIVGLAYVLLVLVFRSILLPLKAVLGFLLSLGATLGFVVFVIQDGHLLNLFDFPASSSILAFLPVILIGILFGLAMDYEIFLVSKMREVYVHTGDPRKAILDGIHDSGKVVTAAGLIMMSVFIGFMMTPDAMIKAMGMALAFGVLFDAFVVRLTIVPAVMTLMGKSAWYLPKWLDKILPNIDVEGESIMEELDNKSNKLRQDKETK
ncbi:MMPL family transporter (plasmid) [Priestia megaterium]|uniref:MMPL family transporter n=1 Tax=Priestia megaterium TaxID=1404 RepID=A0A6M6E5C1_PRIMG|nr:MMPL family transporter [Priestia megaterium]QJX80329.1 MMPL family transporter [Priestia megaterium]